MSKENNVSSLYLNLLKKALTNELDLENKIRSEYIIECIEEGQTPEMTTSRDIRLIREDRYHELQEQTYLGRYRLQKDSPYYPFTLIGLERLNNIEFCLDQILADDIPGDFFEAGVWRGGATIFMRGYLKAYNIQDRCVWLADSFQGLPKPQHAAEGEFEFFKYSILSISESLVRHNFELFELLDEQVRFLPGWFKDTLAQAPVEQISLLRLDADMFESTLDVLSPLYPKLSVGGYLIVDDYHVFEPCRDAIHAYRARHGIQEPLQEIDGTAVFWQKQVDISR